MSRILIDVMFLYGFQLLGIVIRAELPFGLELLPCFWKNLVGLPLDPNSDLRDADVITYNYIKNFETVRHFFASIFPFRGRFM